MELNATAWANLRSYLFVRMGFSQGFLRGFDVVSTREETDMLLEKVLKGHLRCCVEQVGVEWVS